MIPKTTVAVESESAAKTVMRLIEALEDDDDVQEVYANFDIPEQVLEAVVSWWLATGVRQRLLRRFSANEQRQSSVTISSGSRNWLVSSAC